MHDRDSSDGFQRNKGYSRTQIAAVLGGSIHSYMPSRGSTPLAICVRRSLNPTAPEEIFVHRGGGRRRLAENLVRHRDAVPTFVAADGPEDPSSSTESWVFQGMFRGARIITDQAKLELASSVSGRLDLEFILICTAGTD